MKKSLLATSAVLLLALTGCGAEQLTEEETCSEVDAIFTAAFEDDDETLDDKLNTMRADLTDLSDRASDSTAADLKIVAEQFPDAAYINDSTPSEMTEESPDFEDSMDAIATLCG